MKAFTTLIKREFWEHKNSMLYMPLLTIILLTILGILSIDNSLPSIKVITFGFSFGFFPLFIMVILPLIVLNYVLGCLYDEKKNKSILFWRSMPVSDTNTVLSKLLFGMIIIPLLYILVWFVVGGATIIMNSIHQSLFTDTTVAGTTTNIILNDSKAIFSVMIAISISFLTFLLLLLPYYTYCILVSVISKKSPFLVAIIPFIAFVVFLMIVPDGGKYFVYIFEPAQIALEASKSCLQFLLELFGLGDYVIDDKETLKEIISYNHDYLNEHTTYQVFNIKNLSVFACSMIASAIFIASTIVFRKKAQPI